MFQTTNQIYRERLRKEDHPGSVWSHWSLREIGIARTREHSAGPVSLCYLCEEQQGEGMMIAWIITHHQKP